MKQYKAFEFKVTEAQDDGTTGYLEGYAAAFGNVDFGMDVIERGAFKKTIKDKKGVWPVLFDHDPTKHVGWNVEASEDDYGLKIKSEIELGTPEIRTRFNLAKRAKDLGTKLGLSIGYRAVKWMTEKGTDPSAPTVRRLKEIQLFEHSLVTFPMNEGAHVTHAKAAECAALYESLKNSGVNVERFLMALQAGETSPLVAASEDGYPEIIQSLDQLLRKMNAQP